MTTSNRLRLGLTAVTALLILLSLTLIFRLRAIERSFDAQVNGAPSRPGVIDDIRTTVGVIVILAAVGGVIAVVTSGAARRGVAEADTARRQSEEWLRLANEASGIGAFIADLQTGHVRCSAELGAMLGTPADIETAIEDGLRPVDPTDIGTVRQAFDASRDPAGDGRLAFEVRVARRDGAVRWLSCTGRVEFRDTSTGRMPFRQTGTFVDITERKEAEEMLRRAHETLEVRVRERTVELARANELLREEIGERQRMERARTELLGRLVLAQEDERRRIARELHDQFGEQLTTLGLKVSMLKEAGDAQETLSGQIEALETVVKQLDRDVDHMVWELRPTVLDDLGLQAALANHVENWSKHFGVSVEMHLAGFANERLPPAIETTLYRIAQESLNNVAKHARARNVDVILERRSDHVSLIVEDDGIGFEADDNHTSGLGLLGMQERAALVGATLQVESAVGLGTTVLVRMPVEIVAEQNV
jgi:PAS domain S-box-containing protein